MTTLQLACLGIVLLSLGSGLARAADRALYLRRYALLVAAAWIAEDSCIRLYGFYEYAVGWWLFLDRVPLLVLLIWPCVVLSAHELAGGAATVGAAIVLTDAALIEPIAVAAGLWRWSEPGLFGVPPIGVLGWSIFAGAAHALLDRRERWIPLAVPLLVHGGLLAAWWWALRWVNRPLPAGVAVGLAAGLSLALCVRARHISLERPVLLARVPGALFFFVLLALHGRQNLLLVAWSASFAPPYLVLSFRA